MIPMKHSLIPLLDTTCSMTLTRHSEEMDTRIVVNARRPIEKPAVRPSSSSSSSADCPASIFLCVISWKNKYAKYESPTMQAAVLEILRTVSASPKACVKTVGNAKDKQDTKSIVTLTRALSTTNSCSFSNTNRTPDDFGVTSCNKGSEAPWDNSFAEGPWARPPSSRMPPKRKDMPSTSSKLDNTEPSKVALTTSIRPIRNVWMVMIISTAFPKVAFNKPLITSLCKQASNSSVASPRIFARGINAKKFIQKVNWTFQPYADEMIPSGKKRSSTENGCHKMDCMPSRFRSQYDRGATSSLDASLGCDKESDGTTFKAVERLSSIVPRLQPFIPRTSCERLRRAVFACHEKYAGTEAALHGPSLSCDEFSNDRAVKLLWLS
mmetsp:Transcript_92946/g.268418  ORF Transcript_92946/g.268418 Transcript_92946/m.268418 type:complete len:381 (-) Transcript_92946:103-1245(-)